MLLLHKYTDRQSFFSLYRVTTKVSTPEMERNYATAKQLSWPALLGCSLVSLYFRCWILRVYTRLPAHRKTVSKSICPANIASLPHCQLPRFAQYNKYKLVHASLISFQWKVFLNASGHLANSLPASPSVALVQRRLLLQHSPPGPGTKKRIASRSLYVQIFTLQMVCCRYFHHVGKLKEWSL